MQDLKAIIHEARMLSEKVKRLQSEKQEMESEVQALSRECEMLFRKASALEAERVQLKRQLDEKEQLLEAKEDECMKLTTALVKLQPDNILDIEVCQLDPHLILTLCLYALYVPWDTHVILGFRVTISDLRSTPIWL